MNKNWIDYSQIIAVMENCQGDRLIAIERCLIAQAMSFCDHNECHAAKLLGITRAKMRKRNQRHGIFPVNNIAKHLAKNHL